MNDMRHLRQFLKKHKRFVIAAHINPEGDSLGAQLAFAAALKKMGKRCEIVNQDPVPREYLFLPGVKGIQKRPQAEHFDAGILLDCSHFSRIGDAARFFPKGIPLLNIDHHVSNDGFGDVRYIDAHASSTCEILCTIFKRLKIPFDKAIATCLLAGIIVDTGAFRHSNTKASTHAIAAELLKEGVDVDSIYRNVYANLRLSDLHCIARTLAGVKRDSTGRLAWIVLSSEALKKWNPEIDLTDTILNFVRSLDGVEVTVLFKERLDKRMHVRVNLRSRGKVDVNRIASHFGGGGHKTASGITITGMTLQQAERAVIGHIKKIVR